MHVLPNRMQFGEHLTDNLQSATVECRGMSLLVSGFAISHAVAQKLRNIDGVSLSAVSFTSD